MKIYLKPEVETFQVQSVDCFMALQGTGNHGTVPPTSETKLF